MHKTLRRHLGDTAIGRYNRFAIAGCILSYSPFIIESLPWWIKIYTYPFDLVLLFAGYIISFVAYSQIQKTKEKGKIFIYLSLLNAVYVTIGIIFKTYYYFLNR